MKQPFKRIVIAPNAFKGSLTAGEAARCIEAGLRRALKNALFMRVPVADGGEGTAAVVVEATKGKWVKRLVAGPTGRKVMARFGLTGDGRTAVIEMASASGLVLLQPDERNPLVTSTRGVGELIRAALDRGVRRMLICVGGSATNDGGMGMARALGARFLDERGRELPEGGGALGRLSRIDLSGLDPRLKAVSVEAACDVTNPLYGRDGAAYVYGPQKGATPEMVKQLDAGLRRLASVVKRDLRKDVAMTPGAGAAGGLGAGLMAFLDGRVRSGAELVLELLDFRRKLAGCDLVITGEGRLDAQTAFGKAPAVVAREARRLGVPVIAICGSVGPGAEEILKAGVGAYFSALETSLPEAELFQRAPGMLERCAEQVGRVLLVQRARLSRKGICRNEA
ncbi:MAG TPA: glycerate kinase [Verrucomicrobia bacterium]|nr:glycerate kinase [Verrucomicrobiota bacterium]HOP98541.1 glycerate kinase [Verrucomicrobiota bacterium]